MIQRRQRPGLPLQALQSLGILGQLGRKHLDGHLALELGVVGEVHLSHPALPQLGGDLEVGQRGADHPLLSDFRPFG